MTADPASHPEASITVLEGAAAGSWRAPEQERLGGWLLRAGAGFTGRANSALAAGEPGRPLDESVAAVCAWYEARGLPPMIAVPFPMAGAGAGAVDGYLEAQGWRVRSGAAIVMTAPPELIAPAADGVVELDPEPDEAWLGRYHYRGTELPPIARRLLLSAPWQAFGSVRTGGETIAIGRVAAADGWAGLTAIEVDPGHRRQGLASKVTGALAAAAAGPGVTGLYLQVAEENAGARALYRRLGFADHHRYHYRVAPGF
ncbi:MAG TPA: GNAT family N-acetyltransferase [Streptosporangiaceae bacterium]|nr:GNAT family N-acetyltransferase [Streptosporangiaceae bacterium]